MNAQARSVSAQPAGLEEDGWLPRPQRLRTMLMAGRLVTARADHLCRVRNVSAGGMMIECDAGLTVGEPVRIELYNLSAVEATVAWSRPPCAGVQFTALNDVDALIHGSAGERGLSPRSPRLSAACKVIVRHAGHAIGASLRDISQSGCRIALRQPLPVGAAVRIEVSGLPPCHATVRWVREGELGLFFHKLLSFAELSSWSRDYAQRFGENGRLG